MLDEAIDYLKSLQLQLQVPDGIISYAQVGYSGHTRHRSYFSPLVLCIIQCVVSQPADLNM